MITKNLKKIFIFVFLLILISPLFNISASEARSKESYLEVKKYLSDLKTLSADFIQISNDGVVRRGKIHISLPGKLRISYERPSDLLVIYLSTISD